MGVSRGFSFVLRFFHVFPHANVHVLFTLDVFGVSPLAVSVGDRKSKIPSGLLWPGLNNGDHERLGCASQIY